MPSIARAWSSEKTIVSRPRAAQAVDEREAFAELAVELTQQAPALGLVQVL
jgi:hypothetical protein